MVSPALVVTQLTVSLVLLVGAGLFLRSHVEPADGKIPARIPSGSQHHS